MFFLLHKYSKEENAKYETFLSLFIAWLQSIFRPISWIYPFFEFINYLCHPSGFRIVTKFLNLFLGKRWHSWRALLNQVMIVSQNYNNILNQSAVGCRGLYYFQKLNRDPWSVEQQYYQMFCSISESFSVLGWNQLCDWSLSSVCIIPPKTILHINLFAKMVGWT